uniref:Calponin-homology (CH) domain-containing protein n=1 Tax=Angiostrongylus cantonensis TaxID=6313 RepID=A0A0K0DMT7_ANGCA
MQELSYRCDIKINKNLLQKPLVIRPPEEMKQVGTFDPKYQTLAGLNNADVFENKAGGGPVGGAVGGGAPGAGVAIKPPAPGMVKMAATFDPNYQTLAGMNNDDVFKNKRDLNLQNFAGGMGFGGFGGGGPPKPAPKMAGTYDPNYQTLAGMNNEDVFKPKGNGAAKPPAAAPPKPGGPKVVGAFDPNYQTLAGLNNEDVFKPKACNYKSLQKISALKLK